MNRNQKIALGCGGAGCLGLIVVAIVGCVFYFVFNARSRQYPTNYNNSNNIYTTRNSNRNDNSDLTSNTNDNSSSSTSATSISDDDKHKLYQAATMTGDEELIRRVTVKIGLMDDDYTPGPNYQTFIAEHVSWAIRNRNFIVSMDSPEKAREYVNEHFPS